MTEPLAWARKHYEIIARFGRYRTATRR